MSLILMAKAFSVNVGNPTRKLVLLKLADNANDHGECWPSYKHIADQCEISRRTAMTHINALCDEGLIQKTTRKGPNGNSSNMYLVALDGKKRKPKKRGGENTSPDGENISPPSESVSPPSENGSPTPGENISPGICHSFEPVNEPVKTSGRKRPDSPDSDSSETDSSEKTTRPDAAIESGRLWGTREDLELAEWMWSTLADQLGADKPRKPSMARWANDVRLMRDKDGRELRHIKALYAWCRQHDFWAANIQSPAKLREKWSQLALQRKTERRGPGVSKEKALELRNQQAVQEFLNGGAV